MALVGGGGAGNIAGSNPAGTGTSLNYIGDHVYGYSGLQTIDDNETSLLEFSLGNEYVVAKVQFNYPTGTGDNFLYKVYFNEEVVQSYEIDHSALYGYQNSVIHLVIPSYTKVKLTADNVGSSTGRPQIASITGRLYA